MKATKTKKIPLLMVDFPITKHARERLTQRNLPESTVQTVLTYGRMAHVHGAEIYAIGRKEVDSYLSDGINLSDYEGIQVVCSLDGAVMTAYRNHNFRGLRACGNNRFTKIAA